MKALRVASLFLALALAAALLAACAPGQKQRAGAWEEVEVTPAGASPSYIFCREGSVVLLTQDLNIMWESKDAGSTWEKKKGPSQVRFGLYYFQANMLEDGTTIALRGDNPSWPTRYQPVYVREKGPEAIALEGYERFEEEGVFQDNVLLKLVRQDRLFLSFRWSAGAGPVQLFAALYDWPSGALLRSISGATPQECIPMGDSFCLVEATGGVSVYACEDGAPREGATSFQLDPYQRTEYRFASLGSSLLSAGSTGVQSAELGKDPELLLSSSLYAFGFSDGDVLSLAATEDEIYLLYRVASRRHLYRYVWNESLPPPETDALTIWALEDSNLLWRFVSLYRRQFPGQRVYLQQPLVENAANTVSDAITGLNVALLAGEGPDLLILDGLEMENYMGKGVLADITDLVDLSGVYDVLLEPFRQGEQQLAVPLRIEMPLLLYTEESEAPAGLPALLERARQRPGLSYQEAAKEVPFQQKPPAERPALWFNTTEEMFRFLWPVYATRVIEDDKLNSAALEELLTVAKGFSDLCALAEAPADRAFDSAEIRIYNIIDDEPYGEGNPMPSTPSATAFYDGFTEFGAQYAEDYSAISHSQGAYPGDDVSLVEGAWRPRLLAGINTGATRPQAAVDFLTLMLSHDMQRDYTLGLPVTYLGGVDQRPFMKYTPSSSDRPMWYREVYYNEIMKQLGPPDLTAKILRDRMLDLVQRYCKDELSLAAAVEETEKSFTMYFAERQA